MKLGIKPCVIPTWQIATIQHASSTHARLHKEPKNGGIVPPWIYPGIPDWPNDNLIPLPGPKIGSSK